MTTYAQVQGCIEVPGAYIESGQSNQAAQFYSLYIGEPGNFQCLDDFAHREDAIRAAHECVALGDADEVDDRTFDEEPAK